LAAAVAAAAANCGLRRGHGLATSIAPEWSPETRLLPSQKAPHAAPSAGIARAPSVSLERGPQRAAEDVSMLPELMERPLNRYLHKFDEYYQRVVPDWALQYRTFEQQYLYEGEFSLIIREITKDGAIVQDEVTNIVGFVPREEFHDIEPELGMVVVGTRCTEMDVTIVTSPDVRSLRLQTGVVFEWDARTGQGYIMPTEEQNAHRMIRVLRRDIQWHGSRRLLAGQFVQFETTFPEEVPVELNDEPLAPFALRVKSPEVVFSLREGFVKKDGDASMVLGDGGLSAEELLDEERAVQEMEGRPFRFPAESGRPGNAQRSHPLLSKFREELTEELAEKSESPAWLWEPAMRYDQELGIDIAPVMPLQIKAMQKRRSSPRIFSHEVAMERGDLWKEPAQREGRRKLRAMRPPSRMKQEKMALDMEARRERERRRQMRRWKLRAAKEMRRKQRS